jgi:hypothetical protein
MNSELKLSPPGFMFALCICHASKFFEDKITKEGLLSCNRKSIFIFGDLPMAPAIGTRGSFPLHFL